MAYSDFSLEQVKKVFGLKEQSKPLFREIVSLEISQWLRETLNYSLKLALSSSSEKARSEFIIAPVLIELERRNPDRIAIYSGEKLDADEEKGLKGECDFILSKGPIALTLQPPIISLVEAKRSDIKSGLGQCIAQCVGAQRFNDREDNTISTIYGCVTTGEDWQFLQLVGDRVFIDETRYYINEIEKILSIFQTIIDSSLNTVQI